MQNDEAPNNRTQKQKNLLRANTAHLPKVRIAARENILLSTSQANRKQRSNSWDKSKADEIKAILKYINVEQVSAAMDTDTAT